MARTILVLLAVGLLAAVGWKVKQATAPGDSRGGRGRFAVPVVVEPLRTASLRETRLLSGTLRSGAQYVVGPKVAGRLKRLRVDIGDAVRNGQLVAELDDEEFRLGVEQARAELNVARSTLEQRIAALRVAEADYQRARSLHGQRIASQATLETAEAEYRAKLADRSVAEAQVAQRQAALQAAEVRLTYTRLRAEWPDEGAGPRHVGERFADEGALLAANAPVVSLVDLDPLLAVVHVIERDYPRIQVGMRAQVSSDAHPGRVFEGAVARVSPLLRERSRQAQVEVEVPNGEGLLKPGMFVRVQVELSSRLQARAAPRSALVRRGGRDGVFVLDAARTAVRFAPIEAGIVEGELVEVASPEIAGDVVTVGHHLLVDGSAVSVAEDATGAAAVSTGAASGGRAR